MKTKPFFAAMLVVCIIVIFAASVSAAEHKVGVMSQLNLTAEQFRDFVESNCEQGKIQRFWAGEPHKGIAVYYDSLVAMQMALNAGEVDEIVLPEPVAEYFMNVTKGYEISTITREQPVYLALGFRKGDDPALRNRFNEALLSMKADSMLAILVDKYIASAGIDEPEPVKFGKYDNIDTTIKVAVTGDLPPIDYIAPDGTPAGFNTAVLAELAKRMKVNIELVNIEAGARAAALASKRVDAVFWFKYRKDVEVQPDIPEGVVLSETYYSWNEFLLIKKK